MKKSPPARMGWRVLTAVALTTVFAAAFWACQKKFSEPESTLSAARKDASDVKSDIAVVDGVLRFSSEKVLAATLRSLYEHQKPQELNEWETKLLGFKSMRRAFNEINSADEEAIGTRGLTEQQSGFIKLIGEGEDREAVRVVADPVWATVINSEGVLFIGSTAYKFMYDKVLRVDNFGTTQNAKRRFDEPTGRKEFTISRQRIVTNGQRQTTKAGRVAIQYNNEVVCIQEYWHGNWLCCKKRFVGEIEASGTDSNPFDQDLEFKAMVAASKHQRRTSGVWWADAVPVLRLKFRAEVGSIPAAFTGIWDSAFYPEADPNGWLTLPDASLLEKGAGTCFPNIPCLDGGYLINTYWGQHEGKCDDDQWRICNNNWP